MTLKKLLKQYTLPLAMVSGALIYLLFANVEPLQGVGDTVGPVLVDIFPIFMFLVLFTTFCKVDFHRMRPVGWHFWVGLFQLLFVAVVVGAILAFDIKGDNLILLESVLTCIIGPCAAAAAVVTAKLGGDLEEMTTYTFMSNLITALLVPLCFPLIDKSVEMEFWQAFATILYKVCMVLVVPMGLAYIVKHFMHRFHRWILSINDLSFYLWGLSLMIVTGITVKNIVHAETSAHFIVVIAIMVLLLCLVQFAVGRYAGHFFHRTQEAGQALGQKNTAFAIWIAYTYLNPLSSVGPGCYILWQNLINNHNIVSVVSDFFKLI